MTGREKALEALKRLYQSHSENYFAPFPTRSDLDAISLELHKPSFEDAVKVVEDFKMEMVKANITENTPIPDGLTVVNDVLTALRERGGGK